MATRTKEQRSMDARRGWEARRRLGEPAPPPRRSPGSIWTGSPPPSTPAPPFTAACPGDARPLVAIQVGRRYALGEAGEAGRLAAGRLAAYACDTASERAGAFSAADAAANAAAFCVYRPPHLALHWALDWALHAQLGGAWWRHPDQALAILARHAEALEAMARTAG